MSVLLKYDGKGYCGNLCSHVVLMVSIAMTAIPTGLIASALSKEIDIEPED